MVSVHVSVGKTRHLYSSILEYLYFNRLLSVACRNRQLGNVPPLLEVDDLMRVKVPDWRCVFTQVQFYYRRFHIEEGKNCHSPPTGLIPKAAPQQPTQTDSETTEK